MFFTCAHKQVNFFFLPSTMGREVLIYLIPQYINPQAGARGREQAFVFGYVTITEGLHRTYLIESSIKI